MQIGRLFEIVYILLERDRVTAKELSTHFEVSVRTIYRDVETLSESGIPVYMTKGKGGGISLLPDFILDKALITEEEKKEVLASLYAIKTVGLDEQATALNKLKTVFGNDNADWIEVDFGFWSDGEKESAIFQELKSAIIEKKEICFQYTSMQKEAIVRTVEPLKLIFKGASWYLYAYCKVREDYRFFKLKRIQGLNVLESSFTRKAPGRVLDDNTYIEKGNLILVKLKINQQLAYRVYDDFKNYTKLSDGSFLVEDTLEYNEWIIYHLISYGENLEVLEPIVLKEKIREKLQSILERY
jgi:predicted DNA-binding transcriptional regulator YafY